MTQQTNSGEQQIVANGGIIDFLKKASDVKKSAFDQAKANQLIEHFNGDPDKIVEAVGKSIGVKDIESFKKLSFEKYGLGGEQPTSEPVKEPSQTDEYLADKNYETAKGYERGTQLQETIDRGQQLKSNLEQKLAPKEQPINLGNIPEPKSTVPTPIKVEQPYDYERDIQRAGVQEEISDVDRRVRQLRTDLADTRKINRQETGYPSQEAQAVAEEVKGHNLKLQDAISQLEKNATFVTSAPGEVRQGMLVPKQEDSQKVRDLRDIQSMLKKIQKEYEAPQKGEGELQGLWWGLTQTNTARDFATLGMNEMMRSHNVRQAFEKEQAGEPLTEEEANLLDTYKNLQAITQQSDKNIGTQVGSTVQEMLPFMVQFAATSGIGASARTIASQYIKNQLAKTVAKGVAGTAAQVATMPYTYQRYAERRAPVLGEDGNLIAGETPFEAGWKSVAETAAETLGENWASINQQQFRNFMVDKMSDPKVASTFLGKMATRLSQETGVPMVQSAPFELLGEYYTGIMQSAIDQDPTFFDPEQQKVLLLSVALASGGASVASVPMKYSAKKSMQTAQAELDDLSNDDYRDAILGIAENFTDPEEMMDQVIAASKQMNASAAELLTGLKYAGKTIAYNQMNDASAINVQRKINEFKSNDGTLTSAIVDGKKVTVRNPENLGQPNKAVFVKNEDGTVKMVNSTDIKDFTIQNEQDVVSDIQAQEEAEMAELEAKDAAVAAAAQAGIEPNRTVKTPSGIAKVVDILPDNTIAVVDAKGNQSSYMIDEVEAYKTDEQKKAEAEAEKQQIEAENQAAQQAETEVQQEAAPQTQQIAQEQAVETPQYPVLEDGSPDYDSMDPDQFYEVFSNEFGQEAAIAEITDMAASIDKKIESLQKKRQNATSPNQRATIAREIKTLTEQGSNLKSIIENINERTVTEADIAPAIEVRPELQEMPEEDRNLWIAENSTDPNEIAEAFEREKQNSPAANLTEWQKATLGVKFTPESFRRHGDWNNMTKTMAKGWISNDGVGIDQFVKDNFEDVPGFENVSPQDVVDFITANPSGSVRSTTDTQNMLRKKYATVTGKSINTHKFDIETQDTQVKLDNFLRNSGVNMNELFNTEDVIEAVDNNRDKINDNEYNQFIEFLDSEIRRQESEAIDWLESEQSNDTAFRRVSGNVISDQGDSSATEVESDAPANQYLYLNISDRAKQDLSTRPRLLSELGNLSNEIKRTANIIHSTEIPVNVQEQLAQKGTGYSTGFYANGQVYILSDMSPRVSEAKKTYIHEVVIHQGFRELFKNAEPQTVIGRSYQKFNDLLSDVYGSMTTEQIQKLAKEYASNVSDINQLTSEQKYEIAEEFLAHMAELELTPTALQEFIDRLLQIIKKAFKFTSSQFTRSDLLNMINERRTMMSMTPEVKTEGEIRARQLINNHTETPEFKDWFKNSKVVDENGKPLIVYHGSPSDFNVFKLDKSRQKAASEGYGFYFTDNKEIAEGYKPEEGGKLFEVFLSLQKPISNNHPSFNKIQLKKLLRSAVDIELELYDELENYKDGFLSNFTDTYSVSFEKALAETAEMLQENDTAIDQISELANVMGNEEMAFKAVTKALGYDGIYVKDFQEGEGDVYIAWYPNQIKSATGNNGKFDPTNDDIRFRMLGQTGASNLDSAYETTVRMDNLKIAEEMENFSNNIIKDNNNRPKIFYHGSKTKGIEKLSSDYLGTASGDLLYGSGIYLTEDKEYADQYRGNDGEIYLANISLRNPLKIKEGDNISEFDLSKYDGVIVKSFNLRKQKETIKEIVVFNPKNVRLFDNSEDSVNITPKSIRMATGWERGADGQWRYETPDGDFSEDYLEAETLAEAWDDEELFKAYPQLKEARIGSLDVDMTEDAQGYYMLSQIDDMPTIHVIAPTREELRSAMAHEIQHAIQDIEGFAKGGLPETAERSREEQILLSQYATGDIPAADFLAETEDLIEENELYEVRAIIQNNTPEQVKALLQNENEGREQKYRSLAGEVEARNVQSRIGMTPQQRANTPLAETEDVERGMQIVRATGNQGTFSPESNDIRFRIDQAAAEVNTDPSEAQKESGNYKKGHVSFDGFDISIENPLGSTRSGTDRNGKKWSIEMPVDYGYFKGTTGADKDHIDVMIGEKPELDKVYVVDQIDQETGAFDEHKVMIGFDNISQARKMYNASFEKGWSGLGEITRTNKQELKDWFKNGDMKKPFSGIEFKEKAAAQNTDIRFRKVSDIGFYSTAENALDQIKQGKGSVEQFKAMLLKNGAKQAELDWMGFDDQFPDVRKSITKADVQEWIDQNRVEVEEVVKGKRVIKPKNLPEGWSFNEFSDGVNLYDEEGNVVGEGTSLEDAVNNVESDTKYHSYQEPGGENYKELLLTMPKKEVDYTKIERKFGLYEFSEELYGKNYDDLSAKELVELQNEFNKREPEKAKQLSEELKKAREKENSVFESSHFDEPNILAHVRFNERTVNGERVLFIEEIQSDWAQKGKKEGFKTAPIKKLPEGFVISKDKKNNGTEYWEVEGQILGYSIIARSEKSEEDAIQKAIENINSKKEGVPDMPFKQTPQWVNLSLRRMMRYASENGFDRIAWTNGDMQAERYDLSKTVEEIKAEKSSKEGWYIDVKYKNGRDVPGQNNFNPKTESELEEIVGKELASNIVADVKEPFKKHSYSGLDLKVGGSGMKAFYDAIVPSAASKLGKPFGAKPEQITVNDQTVFSIPVTEKMKSGAKEGMPLFRLSSKNDAAQKILDAYYAAREVGRISDKIKGVEESIEEADREAMKELKKQLSTLKQAANLSEKDTRKQIQALQNGLVSYAKKHMPTDKAGKLEINALLGTIKNTNKPEAIEKALEKIDEITSKVNRKVVRKKSEAKVNKLIQYATTNKKAGDMERGKFNIEDTREFAKLKRYNDEATMLGRITRSSKASEEQKEQARTRLDKMIDELSAESSLINSVSMKLVQWRAMGAKSSDALIESLKEDLEYLYETARDAKKEADIIYADKLEADKEFIKQGVRGTTYDKQNMFKKLDISLNDFTANLMGNWETLLTMLGGLKARNKYSLIMPQVNEDMGVNEAFDNLLKKSMEAYGLTSRNKMLKTIQSLSKLDYELAQPKYKDKIIEGKLIKGKRIEGEPDKISKMHIIDIYNAIKNENIKESWEKAYGEKTIKNLVANLSEADKQFADAMMDIVDSYGDRTNAVYVDMFNRDRPDVGVYWPSTAIVDTEIDVMQQYFDEGKIPSFFKERSSNRIPKPVDAFGKFTKHVKESEWLLNKAVILNNLNKVFRDQSVKKLITQSRGQNFYNTIIAQLKKQGLRPSVADLTTFEEIGGAMVGNWAAAKIGASISVPLKQLISVVNYSEDMPVHEWALGFAKAMATPLSTKREMWKIPYVQNRFKAGYTEALQHAMNATSRVPKAKSFQQRIKDFETIGTRGGDIAAVMFGGKPYYDYLIKKGYSQAEAEQKFIEATVRSQQSPYSSTLSIFQNSKNPLSKAVFMFANTPSQYMRKMFEASQAYRHGDLNAKQVAKIYTIYSVANAILFVGASAVVGMIMKGADPDDEFWENVAVQTMVSFFGGMPLINDIVESTTRDALGLYVYDDALPVVKELNEIRKNWIKYAKGDYSQKDKFDGKPTSNLKQGALAMLELAGFSATNAVKTYNVITRRSEVVTETKMNEAENKLSELSKAYKEKKTMYDAMTSVEQKLYDKDEDFQREQAAERLKRAYSKAKQKAYELEEEGNDIEAEDLIRDIMHSKAYLNSTTFDIKDLIEETKYVNSISE